MKLEVIFLSPSRSVAMVAVIPPVCKTMVSFNSNFLSFSYTKVSWVPLVILTTRATAPDVAPITCSPIFTLFVNVSLCTETMNEGISGLLESLDSNTARILVTSGKFREIASS